MHFVLFLLKSYFSSALSASAYLQSLSLSKLKGAIFSPVEPLSSVSSLEVHFDLLDLTELTDMSDQELAEVFGDSDEENHNDSPAGKTEWNLNAQFRNSLIQ